MADCISPLKPNSNNHLSEYHQLRNWLFYTIKPFIPRLFQIKIRRQILRYKRSSVDHIWPIDPLSSKPPREWPGWPDNKQFALLLSHDVDTRQGYQNVLKVADIEEQLGFRSAFNFVPERYGEISTELINELKRRGFGIGLHGLKHDGKLFLSKRIFDRRSSKINAYLKKWNTAGFSSPSMHHNFNWMSALQIKYSISTFDTDPFEPQPDGVGTIFPFWVYDERSQRGFVELPYTLPQDFTLFILMQQTDNNIWKQKLDWIAANGGMALLNTHSDYMHFEGENPGPEKYPVDFYADFLLYIKKRYHNCYHHARPSDLSQALAPHLRALHAKDRYACLNNQLPKLSKRRFNRVD